LRRVQASKGQNNRDEETHNCKNREEVLVAPVVVVILDAPVHNTEMRPVEGADAVGHAEALETVNCPLQWLPTPRGRHADAVKLGNNSVHDNVPGLVRRGRSHAKKEPEGAESQSVKQGVQADAKSEIRSDCISESSILPAESVHQPVKDGVECLLAHPHVLQPLVL
jgi:hypothetical protein